MGKRKPQTPILPARFQLREESLKQHEVSVLDFPFTKAIDRFLEAMQKIKGRRLWNNEYPTWRSFNDVLLLLTPTLTHAFEKRWDSEREVNVRQLLVLGDDPARRPSASDLAIVIQPWLQQWIDSNFAKEVSGGGADLYDELMNSLNHPETDWRVVNAYDLWQSPDSYARLSYRAIPSLVCSLLNEKASYIFGRFVKWRLAHDRNGFVVVSDPQYSQYIDEYDRPGEGTFTYKLEFRVQTQAGKNTPRWLHLYVRCQRYADKPIARTNYGRNISVLIGTDKPRLAGWHQDATLVSVAASGKVGNLKWQKGVPGLLQILKARELVKPDTLLAQPEPYRQYEGDEYYVVYAEGMKYERRAGGSHGVKTGYSLRERSAVVAEVATLLKDVTSPGQSLEADPEVQKGQRPQVMRSIGDLAKGKASKKESNQLRLQQTILEALKQALGERPIQIMVCCKTSATQAALLQGIRELLFLSEEESWPESIHVAVTSLSGELGEELEWDTASNYKQRQLAWRKRVNDWRAFLQPYIVQQGYNLALIELDEPTTDRQDIKGAIREACVRLDVASQMIYPVKPATKLQAKDKGRVKNAVADLLLRQTGALFGLPAEIYKKAGFPDELAQKLTVVALYRRQANKTSNRKGANYTLAVRLLPNGCVEGKLLDGKGWRPYLEATLDIGRTFLDGNALYKNEQLKQFAADVLTETTSPALALIDATSWRSKNLLAQLANERMRQNELDFTDMPGHFRTYQPSVMSGLRIMRVRETGTQGETPQYVATPHEDWGSISTVEEITSVFGAGFEDIYSGSEFLHYLSIGRLPKTASRHQKNPPKGKDMAKIDFGGSIGFRHQTVVEFVPFFLQPDDDDLTWCRGTHYLRFSPGWDGGHTLRPFPMHLAHSAVDDQMCLLGHAADTESEEDED
jgi:hypothetical protein